MNKMKSVKVLLILLTVFLSLNAFSAKPVLKFKNHKFRIIQFTDLHWVNGGQYEKNDDSTFVLIRKAIEVEKPDLIVFTGDIIVSSGAREGWEKLSHLMMELKTPFAVAFGNHDTEADISKTEALKILEKNAYNVTYNADESISGIGNCSLPVLSEKGKKEKWILYLFDSQAYSQVKAVGGYDWIKPNQIEWYRNQSAFHAKKAGKVLPSLAFFHIPLPEFETIRNQKETLGNHSEGVCPPLLNSGLLAAFIERKDVLGVFCGHDHNNDYIGIMDGICLGYGRKTGYVSAYKEILERGGRVIDLYEDDAKFDTYIWALSGRCFNYSFKRN